MSDAKTNLMSAAPSMLAALKLIVDELKTPEFDLINSKRPGDKSLGQTIAWIRNLSKAAIAKAEGEES